MSLPVSETEKQQELQTLKPGANIVIDIAGKRTAAKFAVVTPTGRLRYTISGKIGWADVKQYIGTPNAIADAAGHKATPEAMAVIGEIAVALGVAAPEQKPFKKAVSKAVKEKAKEHKMREVPQSELPDFVKELGGNMKASEDGNSFEITAEIPMLPTPRVEGVSEFGSVLLRTIAVIENIEAKGGKREPISVALLSAQLNQSPNKVAAGFVALNKIGAISQSGEKGARLVELTAKGWEMIAAPTKEVAEPAVIEQERPQIEFELTEEMVEVLQKCYNFFAPVTDIYTANTLRTIFEARPDLVALQESKIEDAYFDVKLTDKAVEMMPPAPQPEPQPEPEPEKVAAPAPKVKPAAAPKKELSIEQQIKDAQRKQAGRTDGSGSKGGRPGAGVKSFREIVLDEMQTLLLDDVSRDTVKIAEEVADRLDNVVPKQVQNAIWKLGRSGFLVLDTEGRVATPVQLTEKGELGYKTNHGLNIREKVVALIKEGKSDKEITLSVGCEPAYIHDVRTGRGRKPAKEVEEAVTE